MDDPDWSWPAWKFGLKREDLFHDLHDQYNTFASPIQDPEAFHHDVYEISNSASTADEFHRLLGERKGQRLRELNEGLESAALEIIANPKLINTQRWQYALQLFRTKSLDSLIRYFASYLPDDHAWYHDLDDIQPSTTNSSISDSVVTDCSVESISTNSSKPFFDSDDNHEYLTHEPLAIHTSIPASHLPPSPRSLTICTDSSVASPVDAAHHDLALGTMTPARTLSFSENESDIMIHSGTISHCGEDDMSQPDDFETPFSSISDISEADTPHRPRKCESESLTPAVCEDPVEELVEGSIESETPTPRHEIPSDSYLVGEHTKNLSKSIHRPSSPLYTQVLHEYVRSSRRSCRDGSPARCVRRTSPELGRIQKPQPDPIRIRPKGRRRNE